MSSPEAPRITPATPNPFVVTIDGPAGVGKSTLAKRLAEDLEVAYLDTGAMFRTLAVRLGPGGVERAERAGEFDPELASLLASGLFALEGAGAQTRLLYKGHLVGEEIRSEEAGMMAARIAVNAQVRDFMKKAQQALGASVSLVAEGRDMGTVVFPHALCKIFLDADPMVRAKRRYLQLLETGRACRLEELAEQIRQRDEQDRNRAVAPLRPAEDARLIDTSNKNIDEVYVDMREALDAAILEAAPPAVPMRRKNRALSPDEAMELLGRAEYGTLAVVDKSSWPYAVPLSFVLMDGALYFHCAREGRKVEALAHDNRVCFTVVGATQPVYDGSFSTYFESAMVFGRAGPVENEKEKTDALRALAEKYLPGHMDKAEGDIRKSFARTAVYRITLERVTGKAKRKKEQDRA